MRPPPEAEDHFEVKKISSKTSQRLFNNANDAVTAKIFAGLQDAKVQQREEVRPEAPKVDPFADLNARNELLNKIRYEESLKTTEGQELVKGPRALTGQSEQLSLEELPAAVRQAAESAALAHATRRYRHKK